MIFHKKFEDVILKYREAKKNTIAIADKLQALNDQRSAIDMQITEMESKFAIASTELKDMEQLFDRLITTDIFKESK